MIYLNNKINGAEKPIKQTLVNKPVTSFYKKDEIKTDAVSFSSSVPKNDKAKKKNKNLTAYILGGLTLTAAIVYACAKMKSGKGASSAADVVESAKDEANKVIDNVEKGISSVKKQDANINNGLGQQSVDVTKKTVKQNPKKADLQQKTELPEKTSANNSVAGKNEQKNKSLEVVETKALVVQADKPKNLDSENLQSKNVAVINSKINKFSEKISKEVNMEEKQPLVREVLPKLIGQVKDLESFKAVVKHITPENKDFVIKVAVPSIVRNSKALGLDNATGPILKVVSPDTIECLDKLAANAQKFNIKNNMDVQMLLEYVTKDNKKFVFDEVLPNLSQIAAKYNFKSSGSLGLFIDAITPQNKKFMFNEALPTIMKNMDKLGIDVVEAADIAKITNKSNIKTLQHIADNVNVFNIKDELGLLDLDKLCNYLTKK